MILPFCKVRIGLLAVHTPVPTAPLQFPEGSGGNRSVDSSPPSGNWSSNLGGPLSTHLAGLHHAGLTFGAHTPARLLPLDVS